MITKKNSCGSNIPLPHPYNFSNGPSLTKDGKAAEDTSIAIDYNAEYD